MFLTISIKFQRATARSNLLPYLFIYLPEELPLSLLSIPQQNWHNVNAISRNTRLSCQSRICLFLFWAILVQTNLFLFRKNAPQNCYFSHLGCGKNATETVWIILLVVQLTGIFFVLPCIESYTKVDLRTVSFDVPPQEVSTGVTGTVVPAQFECSNFEIFGKCMNN